MIEGRAGRIGVLLSLLLVAASCDDSYTFPIIELDRSQHAGTPILGTWKVEEILGEPAEPEKESKVDFESDQEGRLWMSFSPEQLHPSPCAAFRDGEGLLLSCAVEPLESDAVWILVKLHFVSSGEVVEVFHPRADRLRSAVRDGTLPGHLDTFEVPGDLIQVEALPERLREFFVGNGTVFHDRPAVVLVREGRPSTRTRRRALEERVGNQHSKESGDVPSRDRMAL